MTTKVNLVSLRCARLKVCENGAFCMNVSPGYRVFYMLGDNMNKFSRSIIRGGSAEPGLSSKRHIERPNWPPIVLVHFTFS